MTNNEINSGEELEQWLGDEVAKEMRVAAQEIFREITIANPVVTGRMRLGWSVTVDAPSSYLPPEAPKGQVYDPPDANEAWQATESVTVTNVIYITNNVPYAAKVNDGSSKQTPPHFVERAIARVQAATGLDIERASESS